MLPPAYNWTGAYIGINGGGGWGSQDPLSLITNRFDRTSFDINGGMVGGPFGLQIQQGYVVLGVESDIDWANITGSNTIIPTIAGVSQGVTLNINSKMEVISALRVRAGMAMNNWLLYSTAGVAFIDETASGTTSAGAVCGTLGVLPSCSGSVWRPGIAVGGGIEWGFAPNWSAKAEYLYVEAAGTGVSVDRVDVFRGGINYKFGFGGL
jgi:outer membrane immunogenic protein